MTIKQLEATGELALGVFGAAFVGALYNVLQQGDLPHDWNGVRKLLGSAGFAGALAVFGWLKMRNPWSPTTQAAQVSQDTQLPIPPAPPKE